MQLEPQLKMELSSHTDSRESTTYNLELSENVPKAVWTTSWPKEFQEEADRGRLR